MAFSEAMLTSMRAGSIIDKCVGVLAMLLLVGALPAGAERLEAQADSLASAGVQARDVRLMLDWPASATQGQLTLDVRQLRIDSPALGFDRLNARCALVREATGWRCEGTIEAAGLRRGNLVLHFHEAGMEARLQRGTARVVVSQAVNAPDRLTLEAGNLPLDWLAPLLQPLWPEASVSGGTLSARWNVDIDDRAMRVEGPITLADIGLDTEDGTIAAAGLSVNGRVSVEMADHMTVQTGLTVTGGELLAGTWYVELPDRPVTLAARIKEEGEGRWQVSGIRWQDSGVLDLHAELGLDVESASMLPNLQMQVNSADLGEALARYGSSLLASAGLADVSAAGAAQVNLAMDARGPSVFNATLQDARLAYGQRLTLEGLEGDVRWHRDQSEDSRLTWRSASVHDIALSGASVALQSRAGGVEMSAPLSVTMLDGQARIERFQWRPAADAEDSGRLVLSASLSNIDLGKLSAQLGWPAFPGRLNGRLPSARYEQGVLSLDGGLDIAVFDGRVRIEGLQLERPFGVAPTLSGGIAIEQLDLKPLTGAFGFGEISGRLDGRIADLRLVDWSPVAFDAHFRTAEKSSDRKRISRGAVNDLSRVGGAGLAAGLQNQAMKLFDSFSYKDIGLGCRLQNDVCTMRGIDGESMTGPYTIVEGAGLPRITVNGFQRRVDWPILLQRLQAVTEGQAPRVE